MSILISRNAFKNPDAYDRNVCLKCAQLLKEPVQPACGHRICKGCADEILAKETTPLCPDCGEQFVYEDGAPVSSIIISWKTVVTIMYVSSITVLPRSFRAEGDKQPGSNLSIF